MNSLRCAPAVLWNKLPAHFRTSSFNYFKSLLMSRNGKKCSCNTMAIKTFIERLLCVSVSLCCCFANFHDVFEERLIQTLNDHVDAENFTYYRLLRDGDLRIELISLKGDVDIYGSSKIQHPSFFDYEMKSDSCGTDRIFVSENFARPVYIGIYGHPSYLHSQFKLNIYLVKRPREETYEDLVAKYEKYYFDDDSGNFKEKEVPQAKSESKKSSVHFEEDQPLWVKILLGILEFGIDVII